MDRGESYLRNIGCKFDADGSVRFFPGNTVISFIDHGSPMFELFRETRALLKNSIAGECFTFLPDESIHMTVFEGVCDQWREESRWTKLLPITASLEEVDRLFEERFAGVKELGPICMRAARIRPGGGYSIGLEPYGREDAEALKGYRDAMSRAFGLRFPDHDTYGFHISICYGIKPPTEQQEAALDGFEAAANALIAQRSVVFHPAEPCMTYFRNMFRFEKARFDRP